MPNYDIIPLATDLLDYTIQRVKVKEPQYTKVKAYVMENGQMVEKELFEKIKDDGKPHFPKSQTFHMCADMQRMASAILQKCNSADGRYFEKEYPAGLVTREQILQSWQAWDAHAAHGNTWALRQQVRDRVQNILKEEI